MKIIENILKKSEHPAYSGIVFLLTVCESIFLFVPPEVFMTPPIVSNRRHALPIALAAALGSLIGGAITYVIGMYLFDSVGVWLIQNFATTEKFDMAKEMFLQHGVIIIALSAVTPIPYKLMALCAGFLGFPLWLFLIVSGIFRTARFGIVAALLWRFSDTANMIVKKYFWQLTVAAIIAAGLGICLMSLL